MKRSARAARKSANSDKKQRQIVESILAQIPFDGWTESALSAGAKASGFSRKEADVLLPEGMADVVRLLGEMTDNAMNERIKAEHGFDRMRVREKVAYAVRARFEFLMPYREAMKRLMVWYAMPAHAPMALKRAYKTVDMIWLAAGDTSTDYNFYTKRLLLAGVMKTTMLFWLGDETPGCKATWEFLDRRISEVVRAGKSLSLLKEWTPAELIEMARNKLRRTA